jgi:hypothetical protein
MYVDQFPENDMAREMAERYGVPIFDSIEGATTLVSNGIPVEGVISIGEHGDYPWNDLEQHLYPRRRFFEQIAATFEASRVPVFNKTSRPTVGNAKWMYERAKELDIPLWRDRRCPSAFACPTSPCR